MKEEIKKHIFQCKIALKRNLGLSPTTIHNIVKRFRGSSEISVCVGQGRKPQVNVHDLWHCIRNGHAVVLNIATCVEEYFGKLLSLNTVCRCINKCNLNLCYSRRKLYISSMQSCCQVLWARAHLR